MAEASKMAATCGCRSCGRSTTSNCDIRCVYSEAMRWSDESNEDQIPKEYVAIGNILGIKQISAWTSADRHAFSCFLLRIPVDINPLTLHRLIENGMMDLHEGDFLRFWHELDDIHKERRLLLSYFCLIRDAEDECVIKEFRLEDDPLGVDRINEALREWMSEITWIMRRLFIEEQRKPGTGGFRGTVTRFFNAHVDSDLNAEYKCAKQFFGRNIMRACHRINQMEPSPPHISRRVRMIGTLAGDSVAPIFRSFVALQAIWDAESEQGQRRFLNHLRSSEVHWRAEDRGALLRAIESNGTSCAGTYVDKLIQAVGLDRFKLIALGKERFCNACHRSSYAGEERLWSCQRCVDEHVRPKARYCSAVCQRADWIKHKALAHANRQK